MPPVAPTTGWSSPAAFIPLGSAIGALADGQDEFLAALL